MNTIHITKRHSGKMKNMVSINTSCLENDFCKVRTSGVCKSCYAKRAESYRKALHDRFKANSEILSFPILDTSVLPKFNNLFVRFHAFGELINRVHFINFCKIAENNPNTVFALWTKRPELVNINIKPVNMILIYSEPELNAEKDTIPVGFDKVFKVYTKEFIEKNGIVLNCHAKNCFECRLCYTHNNTTVIKEMLK
jgi:hypothetical protein